MTPEDVTKINDLVAEAQTDVQKGWRCGETVVPLAEDHVARIQAKLNADITEIQKRYMPEGDDE